MSLNKAIIIGRLGKDPDIRTFDEGKKVASFSLATSEKYTNKKGEKVEQTEWHNIVIWGKLADVVEKYVTKGMLLCVEGKIKTRTYDDKDGKKCYVTEIFADQMQMLSSKDQSQKPAEQRTASTTPAGTYEPTPQEEDDLPF